MPIAALRLEIADPDDAVMEERVHKCGPGIA
jgi:hypothetical protein